MEKKILEELVPKDKKTLERSKKARMKAGNGEV